MSIEVPVTSTLVMNCLGADASPGLGWTQILTMTIAVLGWTINEKLSRRRDHRKEVRSAVDAMQVLISRLEEDSVSFHTGSEPNDATRLKVISSLGQIGSALPRLEAQGLSVDGAMNALKILRSNITLRGFESADEFVRKLPADEAIASIVAQTNELRQQIEDSYSNCYKTRRTKLQVLLHALLKRPACKRP